MTYIPVTMGGPEPKVLWKWNETDLSQFLSLNGLPTFSVGVSQTLSVPSADVLDKGYPALKIDQGLSIGDMACWVVDPTTILGGALPLRYQVRLRVEAISTGGVTFGIYFAAGDAGSGMGSTGVGFLVQSSLNNWDAIRCKDGTFNWIGAGAVSGFPYVGTASDSGLEIFLNVNYNVGTPGEPFAQAIGYGPDSVYGATVLDTHFGALGGAFDSPYSPVTVGLCAVTNDLGSANWCRMTNFQVFTHPMDRQ